MFPSLSKSTLTLTYTFFMAVCALLCGKGSIAACGLRPESCVSSFLAGWTEKCPNRLRRESWYVPAFRAAVRPGTRQEGGLPTSAGSRSARVRLCSAAARRAGRCPGTAHRPCAGSPRPCGRGCPASPGVPASAGPPSAPEHDGRRARSRAAVLRRSAAT